MRQRSILSLWACCALLMGASLLRGQPLTITTTSLPDGIQNRPYSQTLQATGGTTPYTWSLAPGSGRLPFNYVLSSSTGVISSDIGAGCVCSFGMTFQVTDSRSRTATKSLEINITDDSLQLTTASLPNGQVGVPYSFTLSAMNGTPPYAWSISGLLPSGMSFDSSTGRLSGTPISTSTTRLRFTVTDASSPPQTQLVFLNLTITPAPLVISTTALPAGTVGTTYSATIGASGGTLPYTFSGMGFPAGLSINGSGLITGTPSAAGTSAASVTVADSTTPTPQTTTASLSITIVPRLTVTTTSLPNGVVGAAYAASLAATGGTGPYTFTATGLPSSLSVAGNQITGTPGAPFSGNVTITVKDSSTPAVTSPAKVLALTIDPAPLVITTSSLPSGNVGAAYSATLAASGGAPPYTFTTTSLPSNLSLIGNQITGTPTASFNGNVTITAKDSSSPPVSSSPKSLSLTINAAPAAPLTVSTNSLPNGSVGAPYSAALAANGGVAPYTFTVTGLPSTLTIIGNQITGTPTAPFNGNLAITAKDSSTPVVTSPAKVLSLTIDAAPAPPLTVATSSLPNGSVGAAYSATLAANGGVAPYTFTVTGLPSTLTITGNQITGTPTAPFGGTVTVAVRDSSTPANTAQRTVSLTIDAAPLIITTSSLPSGTVGVAYTATLSAIGGVGPYTFGASGLPATLDVTGSQITGMPTAPFNGNVTITARDSSTPAVTASKSVNLLISGPVLIVTTNSLPSGTVGAAYTATLGASGGVGPYTFGASGLPSSLSVTGNQITGTPTAPFNANVTITVTDSNTPAFTFSKPLNLTIDAAPLIVTTNSLPSGSVSAAYSAMLAASGGVGPYTFSASGLPSSLGVTGNQITGIPTAPFNGNVTISARDSSTPAITTSKSLNLTIDAAPLIITTNSLPSGTVGSNYSATLTASGGVGPYTFTASGLPSGLSVSGNQITGSPAAPFSGAVTVAVKDSSTPAITAQKTVGLTINPAALDITTASPLPNGVTGTAYTATLAASGGVGPYTFTVSGLPPNLTVSGDKITGNPTTPFNGSVSVRVTDSDTPTPSAVTKILNLTITAAPLTITTAPPPAGVVGIPYSAHLSASGGTGAYTWTIVSGAPAGLGISGSNITGVPTVAGNYNNVVVKVTDSATPTAVSATTALSITVSPATLTIVTGSLPSGTVGSSYLAPLSAGGGTTPYTWSILSGVPPGLGIAGNSITGTPTTAGTFSSVVVKVTDAATPAMSATATLSISINNSPIVITSASFPNGTVGAPYVQALAATGGTGSYTWAITSGGLPDGLTLNGGQISGTPTAKGSTSFTVRATDTANGSFSKTLSLTIDPAPVSISTTALPSATVGVGYSASLAATGGTGAYNWSIAGSLPAGLNLNGNQITGTPGSSGTANFTVKATDAANASASATQALSITVNNAPVRVTTTTLADGTVNASYLQSLNATGGTGSYTWSITSGSLPASLTLSGNQITGIPTAAGAATFSIKATDSANVSAGQALTININPPPVAVTTAALPDGTVGTGYSQALSATGGTGAFTWTIIGALPAGLTLGGNTISGTPTASGRASFTVKATDAANASATQALSIAINNAPVTITTSVLSNATVGIAYSQPLAATGGTGSYTWTVSGALPAGLTLSGSEIDGTPTAAGNANFTIKATDGANISATQALSINVFAGLTIASCPAATGTVGQPYTARLTGAGGASPYQWTITPLPVGLTVDAGSGQISGTPSQAGVNTFTIKLTDSNGSSATQSCSVAIASPLAIAGAALADGTQGAAYSKTLSASGGQPPYAWSIAAGALPPGVSLDASGQLTGTAGATGTFSFTARASDRTGNSATADFSIRISAGLTLAGCPVPTAIVSQAYASTLSASGGRPPYTWSISGQLPAGLSFDSRSGLVSGTPTQAGPVSFSVAVSDTASPPVSKPCSITVGQPITIDSGAMAATTLSVPYSQQLSASGGTPPYTWSVASGSLPAGISLTGSGQITGTASSTGSFSFTVRVGDSAGASTTRTLTIQVAASLAIGSCPATSVVAGRPYTGLFTASGGLPPYAWSITSGLLPAGIQLNASTGTIGGSAADAGNYNYTVQALDKAGATGTISCALNVTPALSIPILSLSDATERSAYTQVLQATGGQAPYSWSIASGSLPPGLTLNSSSGVISGTPTQTGTFTFSAAVRDATGISAVKSYTIGVVAGLVVSACPSGIAETGFSYAASLTAAGGTQPYVFTISGGLPPGLTLDSGANAITGTPTQPGTFPFSVNVLDKTSASVKRDCTFDVRAGVRIVSDSLPSGSTAAPYVSTLSGAAGAPPYNWSTSAGALPPGLFLNAGTGQITGTPTITGTYVFTAQIADSIGAQISKDFTIAITQGLVITDCPTPAAILGQPYSATLAAGGGSAPYAWSVPVGALPAGLTLQPNAGVISGTPGQAGLYPYTLRVDDASSKSTTRVCSIQVSSGSLAITSATALPPGLVGIAYSQSLGASGGDAPYFWTLVDGALPDGLTMDGGGTISGTPSNAGSYQFTAQVADQDGTTMRQAFTLAVQAGTPPTVQITGLQDITPPAQQPVFDVQLGSAYPSPITGTVNLTFTPDPDVKVDDPAIRFATGGRTINFSVPANSTKVTFAAPIAALQSGTVAGTIQLTVKLQSNGSDITPDPVPQRSVRVDRLAPKITSMTAVKTASGFEVRIVGYSTTRDVTQGSFHVVFSNGTSSDIPVSMSDAAHTWFQDPGSVLYGGQFSLTQPFQGASATLTSVSVTLTNGQGTSAAVSANF